MVHHSYWNLSGDPTKSINDNLLTLAAPSYLPTTIALIPTGEIVPVARTAFDFRQPRPIGARLPGPKAFDHNLCLSAPTGADGLPAAVQVGNLGLAMAKSVVFGAFIALIGCHWGLRVKPNTQSLGEGTTASVVTSITMVIIVDALFAVAFKNIGI